MSRTINPHHVSKRRRPREAPESGVSRGLLALVDAGLAGVIFAAPLFMGGRHEVGRLVYVACVALAACSWGLRHYLAKKAFWRWSGAEPVLLAGLLLVVLQVTPLPPPALSRISPEVPRLLPLWSGTDASATGLGLWRQLTLTPQATRAGLVMFLAHSLLFLVTVQRLKDRRDIQRVLRWLACAAIGMAALGLAQFLLGNGKFLWIYDHPSRNTYGVVKGTFQNQNHFAHFLILGLGPILWWMQRLWKGDPTRSRRSSDRQQFGKAGLAVGAGLVVAAILLTFSRGGVVTAVIAATLCLSLMLRRGLFGRKALLAIGAMAIVLIAALSIHGYEPLSRRLSTLRDSHSLTEVCHGRAALWEAHLKAIPRFLLTGAGAGSHREIYPTYMEEEFGVEFTHAENGYLHLLLETGIAGLGLMLIAAALAFRWCWRAIGHSDTDANAAAAIAVLAGLVASLVHSAGDFVWYIPACLSLTLILAACACRLGQLTTNRKLPGSLQRHQLPLPRHLRACVAAAVLVASVAMLVDRVPPALAAPHGDAYFRLALLEQADRQRGAEASPERLAAMGGHLQQLLQRDPWDERAHLRLARLCLQEFDLRQMQSDNPMPLNQIRDAALASGFTDGQAQDRWLSVVLGDNRRWLDRALFHAHRALQSSPLQGDGYVYLAELGFLQGETAGTKHALLHQAQIVRPYSGTVMMAAGSEAFLAGEAEQALALWKQAFGRDPQQRRQIIEILAPQMPVALFLEQFEPDLAAQGQLYRFYHRHGLVPKAQELGMVYAQSLVADAQQQQGQRAASLWSQAAAVYEWLGELELFVACAQQAVLLTPNDFARRRLLARAYRRQHQYDRALEQLRWCASRQPDDQRLQQELQAVNRLRLAAQQARRH